MAHEIQPAAARAHWIEACAFPQWEDGEVFKLIREKVNKTLAREEQPVVLLDLDSTLYEIAPRTLKILHEGATALREHLPEEVHQALVSLDERRIGYSIRDTFRAAGVQAEPEKLAPAVELLRSFWKDRFFSNAYLPYDRPYPGTAEFVRLLHADGAYIVYLTGRDRPGMLDGTIANLKRDQFVFDVPRTCLMMKDRPETDDLQHKVDSAKAVRGLGTLVASFENEPRNLAGLFEAFPDALHVFVETICSDHPAPVCRGIYRVRRFCAS